MWRIVGSDVRLNRVDIADGRPRKVTFIADAAGQTIKRDELDNNTTGDPHERWYRFGGKLVGAVHEGAGQLWQTKKRLEKSRVLG